MVVEVFNLQPSHISSLLSSLDYRREPIRPAHGKLEDTQKAYKLIQICWANFFFNGKPYRP